RAGRHDDRAALDLVLIGSDDPDFAPTGERNGLVRAEVGARGPGLLGDSRTEDVAGDSFRRAGEIVDSIDRRELAARDAGHQDGRRAAGPSREEGGSQGRDSPTHDHYI